MINMILCWLLDHKMKSNSALGAPLATCTRCGYNVIIPREEFLSVADWVVIKVRYLQERGWQYYDSCGRWGHPGRSPMANTLELDDAYKVAISRKEEVIR